MSFILPRRLTQFSRSAKNRRSGPNRNHAAPKAMRARESTPRPAQSDRLNSSATAAPVAVVVVRPDGPRAPALPAQAEWALAAAPASAETVLRSSSCSRCASSPSVAVDAFFFFFVEVSPDNPKGADCVCWSATSAAFGGAGPVEPACPRSLLSSASWLSRASAEPRLLRRRGRLQRIGRLLRSSRPSPAARPHSPWPNLSSPKAASRAAPGR